MSARRGFVWLGNETQQIVDDDGRDDGGEAGSWLQVLRWKPSSGGRASPFSPFRLVVDFGRCFLLAASSR